MKLKIIPMIALAAFLVGCGGSEGPTTTFQPGSTSPNDPGTIGGTPDANTVVLGGAIFWISGQGYRATTSCRGTVCTITFQGQSETIDLSAVEPSGAIPNLGTVTRRNGVETASISMRDGDVSFNSFAAWGRYNLGSPLAARFLESGTSVPVVMPASLGYSPRTNPVSGSAIWRGAMVGNAYSGRALGRPVIGDATLTVNFQASSVDVDISRITERQTGRSYADMHWPDLRMSRGAFRARGIDGRFYGPNHEEAGGVIDNNSIVGAFSTKRE